jgi:hypothetical protein
MHTSSSLAAAAGTPWYRQRWPWLLMLGPILVVIAGVYTTYLAFQHEDALVVDDYYKQGQAINQDLRRDRVAARLHLSLQLRYEPGIAQLAGKLLAGARALPVPIVIHLTHPTLPQKDIRLEAQPSSDGSFTVALPALAQERWQLLVEDKGREWRLMRTWRWPQQPSVQVIADTE